MDVVCQIEEDSPLSVFGVAECKQHGCTCYYNYELGLMISMTEPLPSWTHSWDAILLTAWRDYEPACCCFRSWYRVRGSL
jgi:hypothetical protein